VHSDPKCWQVDCDKGPASDKQAFAALVRELKEAFLPRGLLLSAAVSPNKKVVDEGKSWNKVSLPIIKYFLNVRNYGFQVTMFLL